MPVPGWIEGRGGQPESHCHRQMVDAVRYLVAGGITWRAMPADFPARDRVYAFFRRWRDKGLTAEFHDRLRDRVRQAASRDPEPTAAVIDAQSVKAAASVPVDTTPRPSRRNAIPTPDQRKHTRTLGKTTASKTRGVSQRRGRHPGPLKPRVVSGTDLHRRQRGPQDVPSWRPSCARPRAEADVPIAARPRSKQSPAKVTHS
ncbi:transposase [Streptomyces sp. NBC_00445]|uniref:transposase n=1 Tax=Streptomyces sp. NBC_00445 TaxID=2975745 RepID=UPI002E1A14C2